MFKLQKSEERWVGGEGGGSSTFTWSEPSLNLLEA